MPAAKRDAVLSYRVAIARNALILQKTFSIRCCSRSVSRSKVRGSVRFFFGGITVLTPCSASLSSKASESKALSPIHVVKSTGSRSIGSATRSWLWPGRTTKRINVPIASVRATILLVRPPHMILKPKTESGGCG